MKSWLDRCESVCSPGTDALSADKMKLRNELQLIQVAFYIIIFYFWDAFPCYMF